MVIKISDSSGQCIRSIFTSQIQVTKSWLRIKAKYKEKLDWNKGLGRYNYKEHEIEIDNWECVAWAYELDANRRPTKEIVQSIPVTMQMSVEEGWYAKEGSKWQGAMRFQMLQYRAGTFLASIYAPDVIMGMGQSSEEHYDVIDVTPQADGSFSSNNVTLQELRASTDVGSIPTTGNAGEEIDTETGEISNDGDNTDPQGEDFYNHAPSAVGGTVLNEKPAAAQTGAALDLG